MLDAQELLYTVDENNNPLSPLKRKTVHANILWHRTTGIWVYNKKNGILCQKRSVKKDMKPGYWEADFGGHLTRGEEYTDNAVSELSEELGISVRKENLQFYKVMKSPKSTHKEFQAVYLYEIEGIETEFLFEKEEIDSIEWQPIDKLYKILLIDRKTDWVHKPWDKEMLNFISNAVT